jgi:hypothetical protein
LISLKKTDLFKMAQSLLTNIPKTNALNIIHGFKYAEHIGCPMTIHVTVLWSLVTGYPKSGSIEEQSSFARRHTGEVMSAFSDFCRYRGLPNCVAYVLENSPHEIKNLEKLVHSHIAFHVPDEHLEAFSRLLPDWVFGKRTKRRRHPNAIDIAPHNTGPDTVMAYLLKGTDQTALVALPDGELIALTEAIRRYAPNVATDPTTWFQGETHGKRCGLSRQIDAKARIDADFHHTLH